MGANGHGDGARDVATGYPDGARNIPTRDKEVLKRIILKLEAKETLIREEKQRFMAELQALNNLEFIEKLKNIDDSNTLETTIKTEEEQ